METLIALALGLIIATANPSQQIEQKKIDQAIKCYEEGINIQPNYAPFYDNIGTAYKLKNNYIKAEDFYKKSIALDKNAAEPKNNLGVLCFMTIRQ